MLRMHGMITKIEGLPNDFKWRPQVQKSLFLLHENTSDAFSQNITKLYGWLDMSQEVLEGFNPAQKQLESCWNPAPG